MLVRRRLLLSCVVALVTAAGEPQPPSPVRFEPVADQPFVRFWRTDLPDQAFTFRFEYVNLYIGMIAHSVVWEAAGTSAGTPDIQWASPAAVALDERTRLRFRWDASEDDKRRAKIDFRGEVEARPDGLEIRFTLKPVVDLGAHYWMWDVLCGQDPANPAAGATLFLDPEGQRTFHCFADGWKSIRQVEEGRLNENRSGSYLLAPDPRAPGPKEPIRRLAVKLSQDGKWAVAIASDLGTGFSWNLQDPTNCIHQNYEVPGWAAGVERTLRFRVYLVPGGLAEVQSRYERDFGAAPGQAAAPAAAYPYLPTVWATDPAPAYLTRLDEARPQDLPDHPLAAWVADRISREALLQCTQPAVRNTPITEQLRAFRRQGEFWVREDDTGLWLANERLGLQLLPPAAGFGVASLYDLEERVEMLRSPQPGEAPWRLTVLPRGEKPGVLSFFPGPAGPAPEALLTFGAGEVRPVCSWRVEDGELRVTAEWQGVRCPEHDETATVTVDLALDASALSRWRVRVESGFREVGLVEVRFPVLTGLGEAGGNTVVKNWGNALGECYRGCTTVLDGVYPTSVWSMQHLSLGYGRSTLYLACHDPEANSKRFLLHPGEVFYFAPLAENTGLATRCAPPYEIVLGPVRGTWFEAARQYRTWALGQAWCRSGPLAGRQDLSRRMLEVDFWVRPGYEFGSQAHYKPNRLLRHPEDEVLRCAEAFGPETVLGVWWYGWQQERFDNWTPYFTADPAMAQVFAAESGAGHLVMPYVQGVIWDRQTPLFGAAGERAAAKRLDGSLLEQQWAYTRTAPMCQAAGEVRDVYAGLAARVAGYGANAIYFDCLSGGIYDCYNPDHGHPLGIGGHWWVEAQREMLECARRAGGGLGCTGEYFAEPYLDRLEVQPVSSYGYTQPTECPLLPAVYSGYAVSMGSPGHGHFPDSLEAFRLNVGRRVLWGCQPGKFLTVSFLDDPAKAEFIKRLVRFRQGVAKELFLHGEMLRPPELVPPVPRVNVEGWVHLGKPVPPFSYDAVEAACYAAADGTLGVFLINYSDSEQAVRLDLRTLPSPWAQTKAQVKVIDGQTRSRPKANLKREERLPLTVPAATMVLVRIGRDLGPAAAPAGAGESATLERGCARYLRLLKQAERPGPGAAGDTADVLPAGRTGPPAPGGQGIGPPGHSVPLDAQALREALREARPEVRSAAAVALGRSQAQAPEAAPLVRALAQAMAVETDAFAREAMAYALGELGAGARTGALPPLLMALEDPFPNVRFAAAIALGKTGGGPETVIALRRVLGHENRFLAFAGAVALGRVGQAASAAVPDLERLESDEREEVRVAVRFALLLIAGEQDCLAWLTQAARSGDAYSSYWSVVVLGLLQDRARTAIPLLTDILRQHGWWEMRLNAAEALLQIAPGDAATRDTIAAAAARDSNRYVAEQMRRLVAGP